nr:xylulose kinase-1 [Tanacetum cinerariifolium]
MKMEHYLSHTDYPIWQVIQNGNGPVSLTTYTNGMIKVLPPKNPEEVVAKERERKARTTLLMALPEDHLAKFPKMNDAKEMWEAIKSRFGGNDESKKMQKYFLKQQFEARDNGRRPAYQDNSKALVTIDEEAIDWSGHVEEDTKNFEALKEKEDLKTKVENWQNSSKNLNRLLNTQMSANDKFRLGYGDYKYGSILSYENEVLQSVFMNKECDLENTPVNDIYAEGMHTVPPPMTGNYMPFGPDVEIYYSKFTFGPKQTSADESDSKPVEYALVILTLVLKQLPLCMHQ